ncbi:SDR family oxidoreductase [Streptomyces sp. NPDC020875]|uniref:SDR family NAD(P)-dependent oxidoreductase n=1 Tax=Streptomyces sp. NPDC020875 TaxID=3154898 RepID=UPI0033CD00E1
MTHAQPEPSAQTPPERAEYAFEGRTVVVTGGGSGIGRATAHAFADEGARVLVVGRRTEALAETARHRPNIRCYGADLSEPDAPAAVVAEAVREFGGIDVLVNNAARLRPEPLGRIDDLDARTELRVNLLAPLFLTQEALPRLEAAKGTVVNVSTAGIGRGWAGHSVYGAAKTALDFLTRTWAVELAPRGIRVVGIAPGPVDTPLAERAGLGPDEVARLRARQSARVPLGRVGQPEEVARWAVELARPEAAFTTGLVLPVDGGASAVF